MRRLQIVAVSCVSHRAARQVAAANDRRLCKAQRLGFSPEGRLVADNRRQPVEPWGLTVQTLHQRHGILRHRYARGMGSWTHQTNGHWLNLRYDVSKGIGSAATLELAMARPIEASRCPVEGAASFTAERAPDRKLRRERAALPRRSEYAGRLGRAVQAPEGEPETSSWKELKAEPARGHVFAYPPNQKLPNDFVEYLEK